MRLTVARQPPAPGHPRRHRNCPSTRPRTAPHHGPARRRTTAPHGPRAMPGKHAGAGAGGPAGARSAMNYTNLGTSGLRVSRICLGMMGFGNDSERPWVIDEDAAEPIVKAAVEGGVTFFDTADTYSAGASEVATGRLVPKFLTRDEAVVATKVFMPVTPGRERRRTRPQAHPVGHRRLAAPPQDGLRRPVPDPPLGSPHAHRGDDGGAARRRAVGQGPLHRCQQHVRLAVRQGPVHRRGSRLDEVRRRCRTTTT